VAFHRKTTLRVTSKPWSCADTLDEQIEGVFTVLIGILFLAVFPRSTGNPTSLLSLGYFTERERLIMVERIIRDDPSKAQPRQRITWKESKDTVSLGPSLTTHREHTD
jgi:hypothetical protein